jgi:cobalt-zinc-cadmium efflux system membrane fusion protein
MASIRIKTVAAAGILGLSLVVLGLAVGGCGGGDTETAQSIESVHSAGEATDDHAHDAEGHDEQNHEGHAHEAEGHDERNHEGHAYEAEGHDEQNHAGHAHEEDGNEAQMHEEHSDDVHDHEGQDHGESDHEGHDHGEPDHEEEGHSAGPSLSERDLADAGITTALAGPGHIEHRVRLLGEVRLNEERVAHVVPPVAGTIREVKIRIGDEVRAGQVLAVLASRELAEARAAYLGARGRRELADLNFNREKELWERDILAEQDYLDAQQDFLEADIELQAAEQALHALGTSDEELDLLEESHEAGAMARLELRAPISGTVTELHMVLGETVGEDTDVAVVADLSTVWVELDVPQAELPYIQKGQAVAISASGMGIPDAVGTVDFVSPVMDVETRTVSARVEITNESGEWRPGLFVTASLALDTFGVPVAVPKDAVQSLDGESVVFVPDGGGFSPALVVTGRANATHVEVVSGLEAGEPYVAGGAFALKAEMVTSGMDSHAGHGH